jgi:hypothetical protein
LGSQAWLTGTDRQPFAALLNDAQFVPISDEGLLSPAALPQLSVNPATT